EFLRRLDRPETRERYRNLDEIWNGRAAALNERLARERVPVRVENLSSIWTVCYTRPSRYNWRLQFYLRAEGLLLRWVGAGRLIFSLDYGDADFEAVADRFVAAARAMAAGAWWWEDAGLTNRAIRRLILRETIARRLGLAPERLGLPESDAAPAPAGLVLNDAPLPDPGARPAAR